jgi:vitamin B12 transporter
MKSRHTGSIAPVNRRVAALSVSSRAIAAVLPLLAAQSAFAQAGPDSPDQQVVVTAARVEQKLPDALPSTTVITQSDIQAANATDVPGLLRELTSLDVAQNGPAGSVTSVFLRGTASNRVLVLVDGAPLSRADFGSAPWELLSMGDIDHIEIVRGNLSSLYGSSAVGGVVQIFTKRGPGTNVLFGAGSDGQFLGNASIAGRWGDAARPFDLGASVTGNATDGFNATNPATNPGYNTDRDGSHQTGATLRGGKTWAPNQRTEFSVSHTDTATHYDAYGGAPVDDVLKTSLDTYDLQSHHAIGSRINFNLSAGESFIKYEDPTNEFTAGGTARTRLLGADANFNVAPDQDVQVGFEARNERYSDTYTPEEVRLTKSVRVGYLGTFASAIEVQANLRHDDAADYGTANTGLLALGWRLSPAWKIVGQVSTAFAAPTFVDQAYAVEGVTLKPERSRNTEVGVHWTGAGWLARATFFSQRQKDLFVYTYPQGEDNIGRAHNRGVELGADGSVGPGKLGLDATFQNPRDDTAGTGLLKRARTNASVNYRLPILGWETGAYVRYTGRRLDSDPVTFSDIDVPARTVVGLSTSHPLSPDWTVAAKLDNLFDNRTAEVAGYTTPGRGILFTLRGQWQ